MPVGDHVICAAAAVTKIIEVNPNRETLTIINYGAGHLVLADDDQPTIAFLRIHGIPLGAFQGVTLERKDGDRPDKAWYVYAYDIEGLVVVFEGMTPPTKRAWW